MSRQGKSKREKPALTAIRLSIIGIVCLAILIVQRLLWPAISQAGVSNTIREDEPPETYVGDSACMSCHQNESLSYLHTAHHMTSMPGNKSSILGSFDDGSNVLLVSDPIATHGAAALFAKMESKADGFFETAMVGLPAGPPEKMHRNGDVIESERIDIVTGSGVWGQTFLYWKGDQLYELPVTYWSDTRSWINSPGYGNGTLDFSRPIYPRCLECHATYIKSRSPEFRTNSYYRGSLITGISCETCHGRGSNHVAIEQKKFRGPESTGSEIVNPAKLSRDRQVELCALCHSGTQNEEIAPAFTYVPGEPLSNYLKPNSRETEEHPNLHGNQVGLLKKSRCYQASPGMSCSTCHNVHAPEQSPASYSKRCLSCHEMKVCGAFRTKGPKIAGDCIGCHMPVKPTTAIFSETAGKLFRPNMRTHLIKVYP